MKKHFVVSQILIFLLFSLFACRTPVQSESEDIVDVYTQPLLKTNQYMRERHRELIVAFTNRVSWEMEETASGLWIQELEAPAKGGRDIQEGNFVSYTFVSKLLNGRICYSADIENPKEIVLGKGNVEAGIEEGLLLLKAGSKARLIIPPHLAHGNFGDRGKIPGSSVIIVEIEVLDVKR